MPTLYTALLARHGAMPEPKIKEGIATKIPSLTGMLFSESVVAPPAQPRPDSTVIVIGAGFAGLVAAYELFHAGYNVTILEAQPRIGGRVQSLSDVVPGKIVEGGGELIGDNHHAWLYYGARFGLGFSKVHDGENSPAFLRGRKLKKQEAKNLAEQMGEIFAELTKLSTSISDEFRPWLSPVAPTYDKMSLREWIQSRNASPLCKYAVDLQFSTDNGVSADKQSMLGILSMIKGGGGMDYFTETERHRCDGGNQQLAEKLVEPMAHVLHTGIRVRRIHASDQDMRVETIDRKEEKHTFAAKDVILAISPNVWSSISFDKDLLPKPLPQMGKNVKCLMTFPSEFWKKLKLSPNLTSDRAVELTWHATEEQKGHGHAIVCFSGAEQAEECIRWKAAQRTACYIGELSRAYRGTGKQLVDARFKNWPEDPFVRASYAFPAKGDITRWGPVFDKGIGKLHFAGEHTCYAFIGYMEGALQSGIRAANRLMVRDKIATAIP